MGINEKIEKLGGYFKKMNIAEGIIFLTVSFPHEWKISDKIADKYNVKVMPCENGSGYYFASELSNGIDNLFTAVNETITFNEVAGIKKALFMEKITELQRIFEDEQLDVLQTIEFKFKKKRNGKPKDVKNLLVENNEIETNEPCHTPC